MLIVSSKKSLLPNLAHCHMKYCLFILAINCLFLLSDGQYLLLSFLIQFVCPLHFSFNLVDCKQLVIKPKPDSFGEISGIAGESFVISCGTKSLVSKDLQWRTPNNQIITSDSNQHVFTLLANDTLRLFFNKLKIQDTGLYTCFYDKNTFSQAYLDVKSEQIYN